MKASPLDLRMTAEKEELGADAVEHDLTRDANGVSSVLDGAKSNGARAVAAAAALHFADRCRRFVSMHG